MQFKPASMLCPIQMKKILADDVHHDYPSFIVDQGFDEVPKEIMDPKDWSVVWSQPWRFKANILNTEARALVWSVEHLLRANRCLSKKLLCFCDSMPLVLGCLKERAKSPHLLRPLRQIAALCLATGSKVCTRWVVSEHNVADSPSRSIGAWQAAGLERWWSDIRHSDVPCSVTEEIDHHVKDSRKQRKKTQKTVLEVAESRCARGDDLSGSKERKSTNPERLSASHGEIHDLDPFTAVQPFFTGPPGLSPCGVPAGTLQLREGDRRWSSCSCGSELLQSSPREAFSCDASENCQSLERLDCSLAGQQRLPLPIEVLGAMMGVFCSWGHHQLALRLFLQFMTYIRPRGCSNLKAKQIVPPQQTAGNRFIHFAILLHPTEDKVPGKIGLFDLSVMVDSDVWMYPILQRLLHNKDPEGPLWDQPHSLLVDEFARAQTHLKLDHLHSSLYTLRHGGATHDFLTRRRTTLEVKQRGRWSADSSLKR